jgi:hypothetical protein
MADNDTTGAQMSTTVRRRTAMFVLALSVLGGGAALGVNTALHAPTADGGMPTIGGGGGPITIRPPLTGKPTITRPPITIEPPTTNPVE